MLEECTLTMPIFMFVAEKMDVLELSTSLCLTGNICIEITGMLSLILKFLGTNGSC